MGESAASPIYKSLDRTTKENHDYQQLDIGSEYGISHHLL